MPIHLIGCRFVVIVGETVVYGVRSHNYAPMRVLVYESNLMWSSRLLQSLRKLGYTPQLLSEVPAETDAKAAIVNLGEHLGDTATLVHQLQSLGVKVIAHAGHKEKQLLELGKAAGADILATNSQLTFKLPELLEQVFVPDQRAP